MLLLAVTSIEQATAKVPFSMMMLNDFIKRKAIPPELHIRMVIPTSGFQSVSLWDAPDIATLEAWLTENINQECSHQVAEAQENFTFGVALELGRARAADKVATSSKQAMSSINLAVGDLRSAASTQLEALNARTNIITATKETTAAAAERVRGAADSAMQNESVAAAVASLQVGVAAGMSRATSAFSWMGAKVKSELGLPSTPPPGYSQAFAPTSDEPHIPLSSTSAPQYISPQGGNSNGRPADP